MSWLVSCVLIIIMIYSSARCTPTSVRGLLAASIQTGPRKFQLDVNWGVVGPVYTRDVYTSYGGIHIEFDKILVKICFAIEGAASV